MKYHVIMAVAAATILFAGCQTKEDFAPVGSKTITLKAQKPVMTKVTMSQDDPDAFYMGLSSKWDEDDKILVFDAAGNATEFSIASIDADGVATFTGTPATEIAVGDPITAVVLNEAVEKDNYNSTTKSIPAYLMYQGGTLADAVNNTLMYGEGVLSDSEVSLNFEAKTSIVEFNLTLPVTSDVASVCKVYLSSGESGAKTLTNQTDIVVAGENKGTVTNSIGKNSSGAVTYDISNTSASYPVDNHVVTLYFSVTPENFQNTIIQCQPTQTSEERYVWRVAGSSPLTIKGGNAYTITRISPKFALSGSHFMDDAKYKQEFKLPASCLDGVKIEKTVASDWLDVTATESTITVAAAENASGSPRQNTVTFDIYGYKYNYSYTQIEAKDFAGDWTLTMASGYHREVESGNGAYSAATADSGTGEYGKSGAKKKGNYYDDTWAPSSTNISSTSLSVTHSEDGTGFIGNGYANFTDAKTTGINKNLLITGLYRNLTMAARAEVDYTNNRVRYYLYFNTTPQVISGGPYDGQYGAIVTELVGASSTSTYYLGIAHGGNGYLYGAGANTTSYAGNVSVNGNTTTVDITELQYCPQYPSYKVKGLMVTRLASNANSGGNLIRSTKSVYAKGNEAQSGAAYAAVYQGSIRLKKDAAAAAGHVEN